MLRACFAPYSNSTQIYSNLSCWDCLSTFREPIVVALYSHWLQSYVIPLCFSCLWLFRLWLFFAICSHNDHNQILTPYVSIVCAISDCLFVLLCTHIDHNQIWSLHVLIVCGRWDLMSMSSALEVNNGHFLGAMGYDGFFLREPLASMVFRWFCSPLTITITINYFF